MNEKYAKNLRRQAIALAAQIVENGRTVSTERVHRNANAHTNTVINDTSGSLRGIYRYLKKNDKQKK